MRAVSSVMSDSAHPWTVARLAPLSMEFSRQEYCSGLPIPSPEKVLELWPKQMQDFLNPGLTGTPTEKATLSKDEYN